jgi:predicted RNase H-like HicB family nuclease
VATKFTIECDREADQRWIAEVPQLPGTMAYGATRDEALRKTQMPALVIAIAAP